MRGKILRSSTRRQIPACVVLFQLLVPRVSGTATGRGRHRSALRTNGLLQAESPARELPLARKHNNLERMDLLASNYDTDSSGEDGQRPYRGQDGEEIAGGKRRDLEPEAKRLCPSKLPRLAAGIHCSSGGGPAPDPEVSADGRVRSFPHVEGNYAGFIYVPMRSINGLEAAAVNATRLAQAALARLWKSRQCSGNEPLLRRIPLQELHLSVSRTFALRRRQIQPVVEQLRRNLQALPCFDAALAGVDLYSNDEKTRSFVGLSLSSGRPRMRATARAVDHVLTDFSLEPFYEEMRFHVSVAWFVGSVPDGFPATLVRAEDAALEASGNGGCDGESAGGKGRADSGGDCEREIRDCVQGDDTGSGEGGDGEGGGGGGGEPFVPLQKGRVIALPRLAFPVSGLEARIGKRKYALRFKEG